jgi:hypothetical protein
MLICGEHRELPPAGRTSDDNLKMQPLSGVFFARSGFVAAAKAAAQRRFACAGLVSVHICGFLRRNGRDL